MNINTMSTDHLANELDAFAEQLRDQPELTALALKNLAAALRERKFHVR